MGGNAVSSKLKNLIGEFLRYVLVGGVCFLIDAGSMTGCKELFFRDHCTEGQMALCVAVGFLLGLTGNYLLSNVFVFRSADQKKQGWKVSAFLIYALIGLIGLGITEAGMWLGVKLVGSEGLWYVLVKCVMAGIVLIWNYIGRKIFVYRGQ